MFFFFWNCKKKDNRFNIWLYHQNPPPKKTQCLEKDINLPRVIVHPPSFLLKNVMTLLPTACLYDMYKNFAHISVKRDKGDDKGLGERTKLKKVKGDEGIIFSSLDVLYLYVRSPFLCVVK